MANGVEVRVNHTVTLKCTIRLNTADTAAMDNNLSFYYDLNELDSLIAPIKNSYELQDRVFSSKLQEVHSSEMDNEQHTKSLELAIHGLDNENFRNFTISFAVVAGDAKYNKTDPIRVIVVGRSFIQKHFYLLKVMLCMLGSKTIQDFA